MALQQLVSELRPELVLATGDLAHRGRRAELERAREILESLDTPYLVVPGNHDIPYSFPARFTRPFAEWERVFGPVEPIHASAGLVVVGLNSVRPWRQQGGAVRGHSVAADGRAHPRGARVARCGSWLSTTTWRRLLGAPRESVR